MTEPDQGSHPERPAPEAEPEESISQYLRIFRRHLWVLLLVVCGAVAGTAVVVYRMDPIYRAKAVLEITAPEGSVSVEDLLTVDPFQREYFQTLLWRMTMHEVLDPVYEDFHLPDQSFDEFADEFDIAPKKDSNLVQISYEGKEPKRTTSIVNGTVSSFLVSVAGDQTMTSDSTRKVLDTQADGLRRGILEERTRLDAFMAENGLLSSIENEQEMLRDQLSEKTHQYEDARNRLAVAEAESNGVLKAREEGLDPGSLPFVASDETYRKLTQQLHTTDQELADLSQTLGEAHPTWLAAKGRRDRIEGQISDRIQSLVEQVQNEHSVRSNVYEKLSRDREELEAKLRELDGRRFAYDRIQRELDRRQAEYDSYLKASGQLEPVAEMAGGNVRVREMASVPKHPVKPRKLLAMVLAALIGLFSGTVLIFCMDALDDSIRSREEVALHLRLPVIGTIPALRGRSAGDTADRVLEGEPESAAAEMFRGMRTSLIYSTPGDECRTILVSSAGPGEGKTLSAVNLAISFAQIGQRTLLIDADLRRPRIHKIFDLPNTEGLTTALVHSRNPAELAAECGIPHLEVLSTGPLPPNPAEMLGSGPMREVLKSIRGVWDRVVIDSPPTGAVTDAVVLAPQVDAVLQVVRAGLSGWREANRARRQLVEVGGRHVGVILNGVRPAGRGYHGYYGKYYRKTGETAGAGDEKIDRIRAEAD